MLNVEADCFRESVRFWRKDLTKATLIGFLGATSLVRPKRGTLIRSVYYFFRGLDDMLDGEYEGSILTSDPKGYAEDIKQQVIQTGTIRPVDRITRLGNYAVPRLLKFARKDDDVSSSVTMIMDELMFDYDRRQTRAVSSADRLKQNYMNGLNESLNLLFIGLNSPIRSRDIGLYAFAQGRLYSARDFEKDWRLGIINIPGHELERLHMTSAASYEQLQPLVKTWLQDEVEQGVNDMKKSLALASDFFQNRGHTMLPDPGLVVLKGLGSGVLRSVRSTAAPDV